MRVWEQMERARQKDVKSEAGKACALVRRTDDDAEGKQWQVDVLGEEGLRVIGDQSTRGMPSSDSSAAHMFVRPQNTITWHKWLVI